jgi:hypothetical protein
MGGTIVVGDRPGGGAAFTLRLPLARGGGGSEPGSAHGLPPRAQPASELVAE